MAQSLPKINPDKYPTITNITRIDNTNEYHIISAIQASLQYCFWYGDSSFRPVGSEWVNEVIHNTLDNLTVQGIINSKEKIKSILLQSDITLLEHRLKSIDDIFEMNFNDYKKTQNNPKKAFEMLLKIPSFKEDFFHKKALLAIKNSTKISNIKTSFDVPADYRLPQVLVHLGILEYPKHLTNLIENDEVIPYGSKYEVMIRKATIDICREIANKNNITPHEVDEYLITKKQDCKNKHHLTITTSY